MSEEALQSEDDARPDDIVEPVENDAEQETADEAEGVSATSEDDGEPTAEDKPKRRSRAEERINALTREKYEAQKQAELLHRQLLEMQQQTQQQQPVPEGMPSLADYNYDEQAHAQAMQQWMGRVIEQREQAQRQQAEQYQQQVAAMQQQQRLQQAIATGQQKYPDFIAKVNDPSLPPLREINPAAFEAVLESEQSVDLAYYLASNPQEVYAFRGMSPLQVGRKMAQLEAKFANQASRTAAPPPKPPTTLKGKTEAVKDPQSMSTDEWMKWRQSKLKQR